MGVEYREVKTFHKIYICDKEFCHGEMLPTGNTHTLEKRKATLYQHKCIKCNAIAVFENVEYPEVFTKYI